jgi:AraC family transcriptional regulator, positive regulator of tynA and feaB
MLQRGDFEGTPQLDYEAWRALIRSNFGAAPEASEPSAFSVWRRPLSVCGLGAVAIKIQCGFAAMDAGCNAHRVERTWGDVRRVGVEDYCAIFEVAGQSAVIQNGQAFNLAVGDFALVDLSRPTAFSNTGSAHWLSLNLPRQPLISHLGFEPQGGLYGRGGTSAMRLLHQLVRDAIEDEPSLSGPAGPYMQQVAYDLLGALFAPADPGYRHNDKLFALICGIIKERFTDPDLGAYEVATEARVSLRYLQQLFTARGRTCTQFIHSLRLDHAARLLDRRASLGTVQPLSEIAYACGYRDYAYFARRFRRRFGCAPGAKGQRSWSAGDA